MAMLKDTLRDQENGARGGGLPFADCDRVAGKEKEAIVWGYEKGIIKGKSRYVFDPSALLTRAEAAVIIQKTLQSFLPAKG
jgi:hypothetical protein